MGGGEEMKSREGEKLGIPNTAWMQAAALLSVRIRDLLKYKVAGKHISASSKYVDFTSFLNLSVVHSSRAVFGKGHLHSRELQQPDGSELLH